MATRIQPDFEKHNTGPNGEPAIIGEPDQVFVTPPDHQLPSQATSRTTGRTSNISELLRMYAGIAKPAVDVARLATLNTWYQARNSAVHGYSRASHSTRNFAARTQTKAVKMQQEHPLRVLGILAGAAFLAGFAGRIWRSSSL